MCDDSAAHRLHPVASFGTKSRKQRAVVARRWKKEVAGKPLFKFGLGSNPSCYICRKSLNNR